MKTIGIIGGMSPESTVLYYQTINREVNARLGGNRSADIFMHSIDFETVAAMQRAGDWAAAGRLLAESGRKLEKMGAQALVLATNTMHKVASDIESAVGIPLIHVVDSTAVAVKQQGLAKVGLLGTKFTMSDGFYSERMAQAGIGTLMPSAKEQNEIHRIIFEELCRNRIEHASRDYYYRAIEALKQAGAEGVVLGCTEIGLLVKAEECPLPVFDSAEIHAMAAVEFILS
ncbi:aspartate/glutamate racemase family protein [Neisseria animalis]|uniref:Aspartate/glutamate racemase family protein n=1 Tax=Neisseria animalis TaxID=492 RepID=A0A5P3MU72_NEIAN|nr:aspartate/glutamate racemase family protein [Neisseria animalis]QEY24209.1 aspartate/glutamate racemase family protein [Neisseria animalis]ROW32181.1 aspartate/glutamate racemase family protein [Neisseria animalis]VEE06524.1 putative racemase [Neisseria animalis]